ncbi:MAG: hypothetical protein JNM67_12770 [Bacteroidetes bacterium]|nr:hypothetical protein [Bacteroidota bacterium]
MQACVRVPDTKSLSGQSVELSSGLKVLVFLNGECPVCRKYAGTFKPMLEEKIPILFVFPGNQDTTQIKHLMAYDSVPDSLIITDVNYDISRYFEANVTPQAILTINGKIKYSGKIDDRFEALGSSKPKASIDYIRNALNSLKNHETVEVPFTQAVGCLIEPR